MNRWRLVTWNVNSIRARLGRLTEFLTAEAPEVVCLQELKCVDDSFPTLEIEDLGYNIAAFGQKTYNGVAILSKKPITSIVRGFDPSDSQARFIAAETYGVTICSCYVPNGQEVEAPAYDYKLDWLGGLRTYLDNRFQRTDTLVLAGDFNIATDDRDVYDPKAFRGRLLFTDKERQALERLKEFGLHDTFRKFHTEGGLYSWWDYRALGFAKDRGLRIDYILATEPAYLACSASEIMRDYRKGQKPSDHAPVCAEFMYR